MQKTGGNIQDRINRIQKAAHRVANEATDDVFPETGVIRL